MRQKHTGRRCTALVLLLAALLAVTLPASASSDRVLELVSSLKTPVIFTAEEQTFTVDGVSFYGIRVSQAVYDAYGDSAGSVQPGEDGAVVLEVKTALEDSFGENYFIGHSQMRDEVSSTFDDLLVVLVETLYQFCGIEQEACLDDLTVYLLLHLDDLSDSMIADIYTVYKYNLISQGLDGTVSRSGTAQTVYYYAQTDEDWASYPFPNSSSDTEYDDTIQDRSCGVMSLNMVVSMYLHQEIDPTVLTDYVVDNGYRIEASGVDDTFMAVGAAYYGIPEPTVYYQDEGEIDWEMIQQKVGEENCLAIVHEYTGTFTSRQHYMVLCDYVEIDGTGYFLVADPYELSSRYSNLDQLIFTDLDEGILYATTSVLDATCSAVILFDADTTDWALTCSADGCESIPGTGDAA